jgi:hypothetical protein
MLTVARRHREALLKISLLDVKSVVTGHTARGASSYSRYSYDEAGRRDRLDDNERTAMRPSRITFGACVGLLAAGVMAAPASAATPTTDLASSTRFAAATGATQPSRETDRQPGRDQTLYRSTPIGRMAWECTPGYSCYYDGHDGTNWIWNAPSCGFHNLGRMNPPLNDRISSIRNRGGGAIQPYNWTDDWGWVAVGPPVLVGQGIDYYNDLDNIIDAVDIAC